MTTLHTLKAPFHSNHRKKRVGRGQGSGTGKTAGRGAKGQKARSGNMRFAGFEGGQMPLQRRLPKFGFKNIFRREWAEIQVGDLEGLTGVVDVKGLKAAKLLHGRFDGVVVLGSGELTSTITVKVERVTAGARAIIEKAGGTVELVAAPVTRHQKAKAAKKAASAKP